MVETYTTEVPITQETLRTAVRTALTATHAGYGSEFGEITACPFGDVSTMDSHRNTLMPNMPVWPDETLWGEEVHACKAVAQCFERASTKNDVIRVCVQIAKAIFDDHPEVAANDTAAHWVSDKVVEAFGFRIGIVETVVEDTLERETDVEVLKRSLKEVSEDEGDDIDFRDTDGGKYQVKFNSDNQVSDDVTRIDVTIENNEFLIKVKE